MAYCTAEDVLNVLPQGTEINESSYPTLATVTAWCAQWANDLNVALTRADLSLPITDTDQLGSLLIANAKIVGYQVMSVRSTVRSTDPKQQAPWEGYEDYYIAFKESLVGGDWSAGTANSSLPSSYTSDAETSDDETKKARLTREREY